MAIPLALLVASALTWYACHWWYGRKLVAAEQRLQKSEKGRLFSQQQTAQARQQIGQLKAEIESHQQSAAENHAARRRAQADEARCASRPPAPDSGLMPLVSAQGFADTQVLPE